MAHVLCIHPAKYGVDFGFKDPGYFFIPIGAAGPVNLLRREGLTVRGINYPAELLRDRAFRLADEPETTTIRHRQGLAQLWGLLQVLPADPGHSGWKRAFEGT